MPKAKKQQRKKTGRKNGGIHLNKDFIAAQARANSTVLKVNKIVKSTWADFYKTAEGQERLQRMATLANAREQRYKAIAQNGWVGGKTDKELYKEWQRIHG